MIPTTLIITLLVILPCILLALLQFFHVPKVEVKKLTYKPIDPVFIDFIPNIVRRNIEEAMRDEELTELLSTLNKILLAPATSESPLLMGSKSDPTVAAEARNSLVAALHFKSAGKHEKALKLFSHAALLAPNNADILNRYGEFLEVMRDDIISADELYFKALIYCPNHEVALINRQRTASVVDKLDNEMFGRLEEKQTLLKYLKLTSPISEHVIREAYYLHIYHTVGLEGNTMTFEHMKFVLVTGQVVPGKSLMEHNEMINLHIAMNYVKHLTSYRSIGMAEILAIHQRVLGCVVPNGNGRFRVEQVFVGSHIPPPPKDVPRLMESFVKWLNSEEALNMNPVRYAALAHYKLVDIHPFVDGNGRTSRLLMNLILMRSGYPPVIIHKDNRREYYDYLNMANNGDVRPFLRFIAHCTDRMIDAYMLSVTPSSKELTNVIVGRHKMPHKLFSKKNVLSSEPQFIIVEATEGLMRVY